MLKIGLHKNWNSVFQMIQLKKTEIRQSGRKHLQKIKACNGLYLENIKNSHNSLMRWQTTQGKQTGKKFDQTLHQRR